MTAFLEGLSDFIGSNPWLSLVVAFFAGILTSFTPCSLSGIPLVIGYTAGYSESRRRAFLYSLLFCVGMTVVFVALGIVTALLGKALSVANSLWYGILGALMAAMALQLWGVVDFLPKQCGYKSSGKKGALGALLTGALGAIFASPCATPVLAAILAVVAAERRVTLGIAMLLLYSLGHSVLLVAAGTGVGTVKQMSRSEKFKKAGKILNIVLGFAVFALSLYLFYTAFL